MTERALHHIAHVAVAGLETSAEGLVLGEATVRAVESTLVLSGGSEEIEWAVRSLLLVASRLRDAGHLPAVDTLVDVCCTATRSLVQLGSTRNAAAMRNAVERLARFTASSTPSPVAPRPSSARRHRRSGLITNHLAARPVRA